MKTFEQFARGLAESDRPPSVKKKKDKKTAPDGGKMSMVVPMSATIDNVSSTMVGDQVNQA